VWRWQARFMTEGVDGLSRDKRKPGKQPLAEGHGAVSPESASARPNLHGHLPVRSAHDLGRTATVGRRQDEYMLVRRAVIRDDRLTPMAIRLGDVHGNSCAPEQSATSRLFRSRFMVFLGTYCYGHLVLSDHEPHRIRICPLARLSRDGGGAAGYRGRLDLACPGLSELRALFEKRFLRLKRLFATAEEPAPQPAAGAARPDTRWRPISDAKCH
jgi:hypothetical protein